MNIQQTGWVRRWRLLTGAVFVVVELFCRARITAIVIASPLFALAP